MSSILTNNSAMVALDTLRSINTKMADVQSEISTGKKIANSTDNAAIWSIATVMESDVKSFDQVSDSLNLGSATVGVARNAANSVTEKLQDMKALIVAANDPSVTDADREKYQTDIIEMRETIGSIVDAAAFNGQNLLKGDGSIDVLSSLNRAEDGTVTAGKVNVVRQDLSTTAEVTGTPIGATEAGALSISGGGTIAEIDGGGANGTATLTVQAGTLDQDSDFSFELAIEGGATATLTFSVDAGGTGNDVAAAFNQALTDYQTENGAIADFTAVVNEGADPASDDATIVFTNSAANGSNRDITIGSLTNVEGATTAGGLSALNELDVSDVAGATSALGQIDALLQKAIDATALFGSKQKRIDNQNEFVSTLKDSLKTGIGALTDANLEEASARLQSLQVQQQLGTQALSIANQGPQQLLSLFQ